MSERAYMVVTGYGHAVAPTEGEAVARVQRAGGLKNRPRFYHVYEVHPDSRLDRLGRIVYPSGHEPRLVKEVTPPAEQSGRIGLRRRRRKAREGA